MMAIEPITPDQLLALERAVAVAHGLAVSFIGGTGPAPAAFLHEMEFLLDEPVDVDLLASVICVLATVVVVEAHVGLTVDELDSGNHDDLIRARLDAVFKNSPGAALSIRRTTQP